MSHALKVQVSDTTEDAMKYNNRKQNKNICLENERKRTLGRFYS